MSVKTILILTLTAGGGHIQAAKAKYMEAASTSPNATILERDILFDWIWKYFGLFAKHLWGDAQAKGNVFLLVCLSFALRFADYLFFFPFFFSALRTCTKHDIDKIIDTQPLGTSAIIKAIRYIKWRTGKEIIYEKVITDLPTEDAKHFFGGIKSLSPKDRPFLKVLTTTPLLKEHETEEQFWQSNCKLPLSSILYEHLPLRPAFFQHMDKHGFRDLILDLAISSPEDLHLTHKTLSYGSTETKRSKNNLTIKINAEDKVAIMMLGANPNPAAILSYTKQFINILQEKNHSSRKDLLFIFCSSQVKIKPGLRSQILDLVQKTKNYPQNLTIIPISHQNDHIVAPLLHRSNLTITRSGGLTSMELLTVSQGQILIHQEPTLIKIPKFIPHHHTFLDGMPPWESGNADFLRTKKGALLVTPITFPALTQSYFA